MSMNYRGRAQFIVPLHLNPDLFNKTIDTNIINIGDKNYG